MSYTVIVDAEEGPVATVTRSVLDALLLARGLKTEDDDKITIAAENGWIFTVEELEELAKS